ncbi:MAG: DUF6152 family protein [Gammaproteobacteria bacterium]|nr:DUF6152 family protein [Gammaproteobacteria bacterium]MDH3507921.1 DUF6152 family protein [Gammaproteobacteria bacterium]
MAWKTVGNLTMLIGLASLTGPLSAHHSRAMFDVDVLIAVEGVVTNVEWKNPHMWVTLDVPTADGGTESWGFEGSGPAAMVASGISPQILKVGNRVKIIAHPPRDQSQRAGEFMGMEIDGVYYARGTGSNIRDTNDN